MTYFIGRAPGRICLLGDNVDLIEQPALAAAISAYLTIELRIREDNSVILASTDIGYREEFQLGEVVSIESPLKYLKAIYLRLKEHADRGFEATVSSQIPISAGLSSSTALCIAFIRALDQAFHIGLSRADTAELSYQVERQDLDIECGRMDQLAIVYGGVTYVETCCDPKIEKLDVEHLPIVVADTQEKHDTRALQKWLRQRLQEGEPLLTDSLNRVVAFVERGKQALLQGDLPALGEVMNCQQEEEHLMGTSTDRLELFCRTARAAGAWGAKQMGAGGGGCMIALCPPGSEGSIQAALKGLSAPAWAFEVTDE